jgi:hypothetical protein
MNTNDQQTPPSRVGAIAALVLVVALLVGGLALQRQMRADSRMEDCLLSGRKNCAPIDIITK